MATAEKDIGSKNLRLATSILVFANSVVLSRTGHRIHKRHGGGRFLLWKQYENAISTLTARGPRACSLF